MAETESRLIRRRSVFIGAGLLVAICLAGIAWLGSKPDDQTLREMGFLRAPQPTLVSTSGMMIGKTTAVDPNALRGRWSLLFFGFTHCPDVCPTTLAMLANVVGGIPAPPQVVMISVDPARDQPEALARYVRAFNPGFVGWTGDAVALASFSRQFYATYQAVPDAAGSYLMEHTSSVMVINPEGKQVGYLMIPHDPKKMREVLGYLM